MKKSYSKYYITFFYLCSTIALFAQPSSNNSTGNLEGDDAPPAPINDYIWVLVLVGLLFVFFKLKNSQSKRIA